MPDGEDLEAGAVEPAAEHAAAPLSCDRPAVGAGGLGHALVADRDIKITVDADLEARDDVVVEVVGWPAGRPCP